MSHLLHLLRHGAPHTTGRLLGHSDLPPAEAGMQALLRRTAELPFAAIRASDLQRAARPAARIAEKRGLPLEKDRRWRELDFGLWDGLPVAHIPEKELHAFYADPERCPPPDGEHWSALVARVAAAIAALPPADTLVVTHGGAMRAALAHLCGFRLADLFAFSLPYGALLSLQLFPGSKTMLKATITGLRT